MADQSAVTPGTVVNVSSAQEAARFVRMTPDEVLALKADDAFWIEGKHQDPATKKEVRGFQLLHVDSVDEDNGRIHASADQMTRNLDRTGMNYFKRV